MHITDSPWQLIIEPQGQIWNDHWESGGDIWSVGICDQRTPGVFGKPAPYCTREEVSADVWQQIKTKLNLSSEPYRSELWYSYQPKDGKLSTWEPKFSCNAGSWKIRPDTKQANNLQCNFICQSW